MRKALFAVCLEDQKGSCYRDMADVAFVSENPLLRPWHWPPSAAQGLQLIILAISCHEEMGPDHPSKCLTFDLAFAALSVLTVFRCYFTNSVLKKVNVDCRRTILPDCFNIKLYWQL